jgi:hypothetical protein
MSGLLRRLFGGKPPDKAPDEEADAEKTTLATGGGAAFMGEEADEQYEEFCRTVEIEPGVLLMDFLEQNDMRELAEWLHPSTPEPEPKGMINALLDITHQGMKLSELPEDVEFEMYTEGWDEYDGGPSDRTKEALGLLSGALNRRIKLFHQRRSDGEYMMTVFEPGED